MVIELYLQMARMESFFDMGSDKLGLNIIRRTWTQLNVSTLAMG